MPFTSAAVDAASKSQKRTRTPCTSARAAPTDGGATAGATGEGASSKDTTTVVVAVAVAAVVVALFGVVAVLFLRGRGQPARPPVHPQYANPAYDLHGTSQI